MPQHGPDTQSITIGSRRKRYPCDYCFRTLDPSVQNSLNSEFVHCIICGGNFHAEHARSHCPACSSGQIIAAKVLKPPPLKIQTWRRPIEPTPHHHARTATNYLTPYVLVLRHGLQSLVLGSLALLFIAIATVIGTYTTRGIDTYTLHSESNNLVDNLLHAALRENPPREIVFSFAALAAFVTAYAFFPVLKDQQGNTNPMRRLWRITGSFILLIIISVLYLKINFFGNQRLETTISTIWNVPENREILLAQVGASIAVIGFAVIYHIVTRNSPLPPKYPFLLVVIYAAISLIRYGVVCYVIIRLSVASAALQLALQHRLDESLFPNDFNQMTTLEANFLVMVLGAVAVAAWLYHIPSYRIDISKIRHVDIVVRVIVFLACLIAMGDVYSKVESDLLVDAAIMGATWAGVLLPVQRAFS